MLIEFDQNTIANMTAALDYVSKTIPADRDSTEHVESELQTNSFRVRSSGETHVLIDLQNAGLKIIKATAKPTGFTSFGLRLLLFPLVIQGLRGFRVIAGLSGWRLKAKGK